MTCCFSNWNSASAYWVMRINFKVQELRGFDLHLEDNSVSAGHMAHLLILLKCTSVSCAGSHLGGFGYWIPVTKLKVGFGMHAVLLAICN